MLSDQFVNIIGDTNDHESCVNGVIRKGFNRIRHQLMDGWVFRFIKLVNYNNWNIVRPKHDFKFAPNIVRIDFAWKHSVDGDGVFLSVMGEPDAKILKDLSPYRSEVIAWVDLLPNKLDPPESAGKQLGEDSCERSFPNPSLAKQDNMLAPLGNGLHHLAYFFGATSE